MRHGHFKRPLTCNTCTLSLLSVLYPFTSLRWAHAHAQDTPVSLTLAAQPSVTMPPITNIQSTTLSTSSTSFTSSFLAQPSLETQSELFIAAEQPRPEEVKNRVFNYYFLFLALLAGVLAAFLWWIHRHRRREQEQLRLRGQHALAQDVERWANERRNRLPIVEGLNESGEAPPPYKPKVDLGTTVTTLDGSSGPAVDVTIPPRALSHDGMQHTRLPDYIEPIRLDDNFTRTESVRPVNQTVNYAGGNTTRGTSYNRPNVPAVEGNLETRTLIEFSRT